MHVQVTTEPIPVAYADFLEDVMRLAAMHAAIHVMLCLENGSERPFDRRAVALLLYSMLGISVYHLIIKRMVIVRRLDETKKVVHDMRE